METIFNPPLQAAQVRIDPPPKPPDPTNGHPRGSHEHCDYEGVVNAEPYKNNNGYILRISNAKDEATRGTQLETGQDESDSDPLKARTGHKPKERQENAPQLLHALDYTTLGADFRSHPLGKSPHLGREVQKFH